MWYKHSPVIIAWIMTISSSILGFVDVILEVRTHFPCSTNRYWVHPSTFSNKALIQSPIYLSILRLWLNLPSGFLYQRANRLLDGSELWYALSLPITRLAHRIIVLDDSISLVLVFLGSEEFESVGELSIAAGLRSSHLKVWLWSFAPLIFQQLIKPH